MYGSDGSGFDHVDPFEIFERILRYGFGTTTPELRYSISCTLEELYNGCEKNVEITRIVGKLEEKVVKVVNIEPGYREGIRLRYSSEGHRYSGRIPGDLVFKIHELPHEKFVRQKNDLLFTQKITLKDALLGISIEIPRIDGKKSNLEINHVITPSSRKVISSGGMPIPNSGGRFGDLHVKFEVSFPDFVPEESQGCVFEIFGPTNRDDGENVFPQSGSEIKRAMPESTFTYVLNRFQPSFGTLLVVLMVYLWLGKKDIL
eukprot:TRINITY_DN4458_c0_g2_i7.p1 TRINITY_DN4458_c0_g2~~TRINITY_DN4458_c0_g2_i7.p1  ORF type:complete len:260 (-),score=56.78 TRINITY_DN4458_c0_g2_i7:159-938(-)